MYKSGLITLLLFCSLFSIFGEEVKKKNILVMHSYHQGLDWTDSISDGIRSVFSKSEGTYELFFEYLDTKRNPGEEYFRRLSEFEKQKNNLLGLNFDVIISSDNDALRFLVMNGEELFGNIPVVFCGVNDFDKSLLRGKQNMTGIPEAIDYRSTLNAMSRIHKDKTKVLIIADRTTTGNAVAEEVKLIAEEFQSRFEFEYYRDFAIDEVEKTISSLGREYLIYLLVMNSDINGYFISYDDAVKMVYKASSVPIYGSWDFYFGKGIVGGMIISGFSQGEKAGQMALRLIKGESVENIPIEVLGGNEYMFDYRYMKQFGIDSDQLPEDSLIINMPESLVSKYKGVIILTSTFFILLILCLFIFNQYQKRKREQLKKMNQILDRRVKEALSELDTLSGLLPICAKCKKIRNDSGYWDQIETYFEKKTNIDFSHGLCPDCAVELYPKHFKKKEE